jgi:putative transposase
VLDETGAVVRPWLTIVIDDHSRAIAAWRLSTSAPSALQTALALRNAIWRKAEPGWTVCGIPEVLYTDHGSDFTSRHIEQVCAELKAQLIFSRVAQPRGRGRIERFFGTLNTCCLAELPGYIAPGGPSAKPALTLVELDEALRHFIIHAYHQTPHSVTGENPQARWSRGGFLPRMPISLEQLDLLLLTVVRPRQVHRDGIRFQSLRYIAPTLAAFVGDAVTIRYDPADIAEIRVYQGDRFVCRAICQELAGEIVSLKDIVRARDERRRALQSAIKGRRSLVDQVLIRPAAASPAALPAPPIAATATKGAHRLRRYEHE